MQEPKDQPGSFPAPVYRDTVLGPIFEEAKRYFLQPLLAINFAHTLMLARQRIVPLAEAAEYVRALRALSAEDLRSVSYDGTSEDLFFYVNNRLAAICGEEIAGKMHTARSRNDIDMTMYRIVLRERLVRVYSANLGLRRLLIEYAAQHMAALMPAYTHNQPAQPTTLGHYLMAYIEVLERDGERLQGAFRRLNRNPLGACAITTTGFSIDRSYTEALLGFEGLQVNSYGAIAAVDYIGECCSSLGTAMLSLGRFAQDLLLWSTAEFGYLRLSDAYVQISSIMPQKRNPVPLEHVRVLASRALTQSQGVLGCLHNTPFGDMNDAEDQLQPLIYQAFEDAERSLLLLTGALSEATFNLPRMKAAAEENFLTVTELADTLVRQTGMSFHRSHSIVARSVRKAGTRQDRETMAALVEAELASLQQYAGSISREQLMGALTAQNFVSVRSISGGPAREALEPEISRARTQLESDEHWRQKVRQAWAAADQLIRQDCDLLLRHSDGV